MEGPLVFPARVPYRLEKDIQRCRRLWRLHRAVHPVPFFVSRRLGLWFYRFGFLIDWSRKFNVVVCGDCIVQCTLYLFLFFAVWIRPDFDCFFTILVDCRYGKKRRNGVVLLHVD
jgi:hypothetical protein